MLPFIQDAPRLPHPWDGDQALQGLLRRALPAEALRDMEGTLAEMGGLALDFHAFQLRDRLNEPRHIPFDPWGRRIDRIEMTPLWAAAERLAAEKGLVATAYERRHGALSRLHQFALVYLFNASSDVYTCPLAMTDGAAQTLLRSRNEALIARAVPRLISREPETFWTSGQWMTESSGGSDVGLSQSVAKQDGDGVWRLWGRKWFTSAAASQMALTLARPEGNGPGGKGLAMFYAETRDAEGLPNGLRVNRLKDKLGTRKLPTAELDLDGMVAIPVQGLEDGVRAMAPMLNVTRTWNSITAASFLRRGLDLARDYARRRVAFGAPLSGKPLHLETLAGVAAESEAALHLAFRAAAEMGREETGQGDAALMRLLAPLAKLTTARQAVAGCSELLEAFGGAGYVEDTGLPVLLRDAQVLSIWEGTTNVLSLELMKGLQAAGFGLYRAEVESCLEGLTEPRLLDLASLSRRILDRAESWWGQADEAGARGFALTLGRLLALALLLRQAQWLLDAEQDGRVLAAAERFARNGVDLLGAGGAEASRSLAMETFLRHGRSAE
ncbi:MAG TPA: acyl-CoA dehydrogenase family protein [Holophagaceae bacterium]|nr:acyl-CoA dehydrogenase family protein [Holophagaceae bacterium]